MGLTTQWSAIERLEQPAASEAWQWFIERYRDFVGAVLRRSIWSEERADAANDEFWGYLFQSGAIGRLHRQGCFRAFLTATLRNYALDWMRRNPRVKHLECATLATPAGVGEDEEVVLWARQLLHNSLQRLEREQPRQAWMLRAFYGVPQAFDGDAVPPRRATEIAAELDCAANALHQLLFRARRKLHELLVEEIRQTVTTRSDLAAESRVLLSAVGRTAPGILGTDSDPGSKS